MSKKKAFVDSTGRNHYLAVINDGGFIITGTEDKNMCKTTINI
ncbi:MAG: hypothetical protein WCC17_15440 [Candidatus Nitrosopolaris sp.]